MSLSFAFGFGIKNTHGSAASPKRIAQSRKGGRTFKPECIAIKFKPQITTVRIASKRCFGFKLIVFYYELVKTIRLRQEETDTVVYINWGTDL